MNGDGALVKVHYRATRDQARRINHHALTTALVDAGAAAVKIVHEPVREDRARVEGVTEDLGPLEALDAWLSVQDPPVPEPVADGMRDWTREHLAHLDLPATAAGASGAFNPTHLRLRNLGSFADLDLALPEGLVAIIGANGAGKSTLVGAIDLALFGKEGKSWEPYVRDFCDEMMVELTFERGGETFRVRRGFARGKATCDFERLAA
jgi:hypothetical protein